MRRQQQEPLDLPVERVGAQRHDWNPARGRVMSESREHLVAVDVGEVKVEKHDRGLTIPGELGAELACHGGDQLNVGPSFEKSLQRREGSSIPAAQRDDRVLLRFGTGRCEVVGGEAAFDDFVGDVDEKPVVGAGVAAYADKRSVGVNDCLGGDHAFGLLERDSTGEGNLQLLVEYLVLASQTLLQDADAGYVGHCLTEGLVAGVESIGAVDEHVECADARVAQSHR